MKDIYQLLQEYAGLTRQEAEAKLAIEDNGAEWILKLRTHLEYSTYRAILDLARDHGGAYDPNPPRKFIVPKPTAKPRDVASAPQEEGVKPQLLEMENKKNETQDYSLARSLHSPLQQLVPCLADAEGKIFDGFHRKKINPNAWTVKLDHIKTPVDRALARMAVNFCRRHYTAEEMREDIGMLIGFGYTVKQISEMTGISERTIYRYMPDALKDKERAEKISEAMKSKSEVVRKELTAVSSYPKTQEATVQLDKTDFLHIQQQIAQQLTECEGCGRRVHRTRLKIVKGKLLCPLCRGEKPQQPQRERRVKVAKPKDTWQHRKAQMQPQHSQMELAVLEKLNALGVPVETDVPFCLQRTIPDFYFPTKNVAVYLDGPVHKGREDRDENQRELLARLYGITVVSISYERHSVQETERIIREIREAIH